MSLPKIFRYALDGRQLNGEQHLVYYQGHHPEHGQGYFLSKENKRVILEALKFAEESFQSDEAVRCADRTRKAIALLEGE